MHERDNEKLSERIADARRAILDRADEVLLHPSSDEWQPLNHALRTLQWLEGGLSREENAAPRPTRTEEVEAALDVLFAQPVSTPRSTLPKPSADGTSRCLFAHGAIWKNI